MGQSLATNQPAKVEVADWVKSYSSYQIVSARDYKYPVNALAPNHDSSRDEYKLGKHFRKFNRAQDQKVVYGSSPFTTNGSFPLTMFAEGTLNDVSDTYANFLVCLKDTSTLAGTSWIGILSNGNKIRAACWDGGGYREYQSTTTYTASQLLRIVAVFKEDKTFDIYVDGSLVNTTLVNGSINYAAFNTSYLAIGGAISSNDAGNTSVSLAGAFKGYPPKEFIENIWSCLKITEEQTVLVPKYVPCTKQPQRPVEIDTSNPLTIGLVDITHSLMPMDKAMGFSGSAGYLENTTAGAKIVSSTSGIRLTKPINHCVLGTSNGITISTLVFGRFGIADNGLSYGLERITGSSLVGIFSTLTAGRARLIVEDSTGAIPVYVQSTGTVYSDSAPCVATLVLVGTSLKFYINGILNTTATIPQFQVIVDSARVAAYKLGTTANPHFIWGATWGRALSDIEVIQLSANPWQLFHQRTLTAVREEAVVEYKQPTQPREVDWSNPITRGLQVASFGNHLSSDGISNATSAYFNGVTSNNEYVITNSGLASYIGLNNATLPGDPGAFSYASVFEWDGTTSGGLQYLVGKDADGTIFNVMAIAGDASYANFYWGSGSADFRASASIPANIKHVISCSTPPSTSNLGSDGSMWLNGASLTPNLGAGTGAHQASSGTGAFVGGRPIGGRSLNGKIYLSVIWGRVLTAEEHKSFQANPWQIFKPTAPNIGTKENRKPIIRESNMLGTSKRKLSDMNLLEVLRKPMMKQPQATVDIDWQNPITKGLVFMLNPGTRSVFNGRYPASRSVFTVGGVGYAYDSSADNAIIPLSAPVTGARLTLFGIACRPALAGVSPLFGLRFGDACHQLLFDTFGSGSKFGLNAPGAPDNSSGLVFPTDSLPHTFSSVSRETGVTYRVDNNTAHVSVLVNSATYNEVEIFSRATRGDVSVPGSRLMLALAWNRPLSDLELSQLHTNPWQLFRQSSNLPLLK